MNPVNHINKEIPNDFYSATRVCSNIVYENGKIDGIKSFKKEHMTFRGLEKYGYTQLKTSSLNNTISPVFSSLSKFL